MREIIFLVAVLVIQGCASIPVNSKYEEYKAQINDIHDKALVPDDAPYVTQELATRDYQRSFAVEQCGLDDTHGKLSKSEFQECNKKLKDQIYARLNLKYPAADGKTVEQRCAAYPKECKEGTTFERWARESHNQRVEESRKAKLAELELWRENVLAETQLQQDIALQNAGRSLSGLATQLNQQQQPAGPMQPIYQQCQSRPDGLGGFHIYCGP